MPISVGPISTVPISTTKVVVAVVTTPPSGWQVQPPTGAEDKRVVPVAY
jgi:hypothetical protein